MIAVDWGTSSFRAYRLGGDGRVLDSRSAPNGILSIENGKFSALLDAQAGDWIRAGDGPVVMSGMIGSRQGWLEVPYAACPAGFDEIATGMRKVTWSGGTAWIAPGLSCRDEVGIPDVMRGEEVQILGVLDRLGLEAHTICLPGTHSKWVEVSNGKIAGFTTHMTGEAFAVFKAHTILGRMMKEGTSDVAAFIDGVRRSADAGGLLHHLFGVRARGLLGELADPTSASYLSGILIGHEIRSAHRSQRVVHLLCSVQLVEIYGRAFSALGIEGKVFDPDSVTKGLFRLAAYL
ncbi:MAG TPA: 2-dehydro-3-deoxygalactonokinase [Burkholderiales bacterium]|nr:2-dehydro-3-deoxygalactonokinase [Burkholderiales bacterium]